MESTNQEMNCQTSVIVFVDQKRHFKVARIKLSSGRVINLYIFVVLFAEETT